MIAVDIGNTNINIAWFHNGTLLRHTTVPTRKATPTRIKKLLCGTGNETVIICSVVPAMLKRFHGHAKHVYVVGKNIAIPIKSLYNSKQVGMDRLVGAYAAHSFFPRTRVIIDFGTAITLDFLSRRGVYQGGIILPGIGSTQRVFSECALLPKKIVLKKSGTAIPRTTAASITTGIETGFSVMLNGLIHRYRRALRLAAQDRIVITGGEARSIMHYLHFQYCYEPFLVLKGLALLAEHSHL